MFVRILALPLEPQKTTLNSFPKPDEAVNGWSLHCAKWRDFACVVFGLSGFPSRKENGLLSSRALRERNRTIERSSEDERTHHNTRHPTRRTTRRGHAMGGDAPGVGNSRAVLALNSAGRRSPSRHPARRRAA